MQAGAFTALAAVVRGGCASSSDQVHATGIEAMAPPNSRSPRSTADYYSILNRGVTKLSLIPHRPVEFCTTARGLSSLLNCRDKTPCELRMISYVSKGPSSKWRPPLNLRSIQRHQLARGWGP
jgi:hypothetical protein